MYVNFPVKDVKNPRNFCGPCFSFYMQFTNEGAAGLIFNDDII